MKDENPRCDNCGKEILVDNEEPIYDHAGDIWCINCHDGYGDYLEQRKMIDWGKGDDRFADVVDFVDVKNKKYYT